MRTERVEYFIDSFIDENGITRNFVIAAVSEVFPKFSEDDEKISFEAVYYDEWDSETIDLLVKGIKLGFAVCNPIDKFDEELGMKIAYGRAKKNSNYAIYSTQLGYINTKMVQAFLEQEAEYFKANPERIIAGYKRMK